MSLHARMSPAARAAITRQRRNARAASLLAGILGTVLLSLGLALLLIPPKQRIVIIPPITGGYEPDKPLVDPPKVRTSMSTPAAPGAPSMRHLRAHTIAPLSLPEVDPSDVVGPGVGESFPGVGVGDDLGDTGMQGDDFQPIPAGLRKRCTAADRLDRLQQAGAPTEADEHVLRALRFLKSTQAADGGWGRRHRSAMTGLALLAYLGHCETAISEEFGESCLNAITFLTDVGMKHDGRLVADTGERHWPYEQAIATYALAEAESFHRALAIRLPGLRDVVGKAGQLIIDGQHESGGWDYAYETEGSRGGDLSITGWQLQALKACKLTGLDFHDLRRCVRDGLDYVGERQAADGGFGYQSTRPAGDAAGASLTGVGMLSYQIWAQAAAAPVRKGERYAAGKLRFEWDGPECDLYAHYYLSQAMFRRGGDTWESYRPQIFDVLMPHQADDGSWPVPGGGAKPRAVGALFADDTPDGRHYRTALAALMLEVPYRYLPMSR